MRCVYLWDGAEERPTLGFERDQALLAALGRGVAAGEARVEAYARLWRWPREGLAFGRYHRMAGARRRISRRLSGGKVVALGPGVLGLTLVVPGVSWFDPGKAEPRFEQILNRALRPLLGVLRELGIPAFYPGRDLITVDGRVIAHAAFTLMPDGALVIEQHLNVSGGLAESCSLLARLDPAGVAATDASAFAHSTSIGEIVTPPNWWEWPALVAEQLRTNFACNVDVAACPPSALADMNTLDGQAFLQFCSGLGAVPSGWKSAAAPQSLGVVEVAARVVEGRIGELVVSGDVIAPATTLELIAEHCVGHPPAAATARRALASVLSRPEHFIFGAENLDDLVGRMA